MEDNLKSYQYIYTDETGYEELPDYLWHTRIMQLKLNNDWDDTEIIPEVN